MLPCFVGQNWALVARFWILAPTRSPLVPHLIAGPHYLKPSLLHSNRVPSAQKPMLLHFIGQNRALAARFWILALTRSSLMPHPIAGPHYLKPSLVYSNRVPSAWKPMPPCFVGQNQALAARFWILAPTRPPLMPHPIAPPHHLKPGIPHPSIVPSTRKWNPLTCCLPNPNSSSSVSNFGLVPPTLVCHLFPTS